MSSRCHSILFPAALLSTLLLATPAIPRPTVDGCPVFPPDNVWNVRVDDLPVHASSALWIDTIGDDVPLHADFGSGEYPPGSGSPIGIPWVSVAGDQPRVPVSFLYDDESDPGPYPIPADAPIEGGAGSDGDRHVLVLDRDVCRLYELFDARTLDGGASWSAGSGAIFDLGSNELRPRTWTSADAAGLPILPGLVRYEEAVAAAGIGHALRFTAPETRRDFVWPARHFASSLTDARYPPMGIRVRLRAGFDLSGMSTQARAVAEALQIYGALLADNGSAWFLSGVPDERWDNDALRDLRRIRGRDLEVVDVSSLIVGPDTGATTRGEGPDGPDQPDEPDEPEDPNPCVADERTHCLAGDRFGVRASFTAHDGAAGEGRVVALTGDTGAFWFFDPDNVEVIVKVLDACAISGRFWVFAAGLTDVEVELRVVDSTTGEARIYRNAAGTPFAPVQDTGAFDACP